MVHPGKLDLDLRVVQINEVPPHRTLGDTDRGSQIGQRSTQLVAAQRVIRAHLSEPDPDVRILKMLGARGKTVANSTVAGNEKAASTAA